MASILCILCLRTDFASTVKLQENNLDKLKNLLQATKFDMTKVKNYLVCELCNDMIHNIFNFKSKVMEQEDKLLSRKGELQERNYLKICKICSKYIKTAYIEIESYPSILGKPFRFCFPELDIFITSKTYICLDCHKIVLKYYGLLMKWMKALLPEHESLLAVPKKMGRDPPRNKRPCTVNLPEEIENVGSKRYRYSFICEICPGIFDSTQTMQDHLESHDQTELICWKCGGRFNRIRALKTHFALHGKSKLYKVTLQEIESDEESNENKSKENAEQKAKKKCIQLLCSPSRSQFRCSKCRYDFDNVNDFKLHMASVHQRHQISIRLMCFKKMEPQKGKDGESSVQHADPIMQKHQPTEASYREHCSLNKHTVPGRINIATVKKLLKSRICAIDPKPPADESKICSKCSEKFKSHSELSAHTCEIITILIDPPATTEDQFECLYCLSAFTSYESFAEHRCLEASTNRVTKNPLHSLFKQHHQCTRCYLGFETKDELSQHTCTNLNISSKDLEMVLQQENNLECSNCKATFYTEDESRKHTCVNTVVESEPEECHDATKDNGKTMEKKFDCVGCDFTTSKKKDLQIHFYHCAKVKQCHCCASRTDVSQRLEHNACHHCRFVTSMEENFQAHIAVHKGELDEDDLVWEDATDIQEIADASIDKEINSDAGDTGFHPMPKVGLDEDDIVWEDATHNQEISDASIDKEINSDEGDTGFHPMPKVGLDEDDIVWEDATENQEIADASIDKEINSDAGDNGFHPMPKVGLDEDDIVWEDATENQEIAEAPIKKEINSDAEDTDNAPDILKSNSPSPNTATVSQVIEVIDTDSDSEDEFIETIESRLMDASTVVENICPVDADDAFELISQGVPVVSQTSLSQFQSVIVHSESESGTKRKNSLKNDSIVNPTSIQQQTKSATGPEISHNDDSIRKLAKDDDCFFVAEYVKETSETC